MARPKLSVVYKFLDPALFTNIYKVLTSIDVTKPIRYFVFTTTGVLGVWNLVQAVRSRKQAHVEAARALVGKIATVIVIWYNSQLGQWWYEQIVGQAGPN